MDLFYFYMATGHDSEEVRPGLGESLDSTNQTSSAGVYVALDKLQSKMDCESDIDKMGGGGAFVALEAASHELPKAEKRKFIETDEGSDESNDDDYDDEADL